MRAGRILVVLAAVCVAAAGPSTASEPWPADTVPSTGAPPLVHDGGRDRLPAWVDACVTSGRRQTGTRAGGDLLYSAGIALAQDLAQPDRALDVLGEAASAYPGDAPYRGLALLAAAELHLAGGDAVAARRLLEAAQASTGRPPPVDADPVASARHTLLVERVALVGPRLGIRIAEASGDLAMAAEQQQAIATRLDRRGEPGAARAWALAARMHARGGDAKLALAAVDRALELVEGDEARANLSFWRLHLRHGLLDEDGAPALGTRWPGDAFVADTEATLRGLRGNPRVGSWLLALASQAVTSQHDEVALDLYLLALGDPVLVDRARTDPDLSGGLLVAFPVALRLGRLEEAERILDVVAGVAAMSADDLDALRLALSRARDEAARAAAPTPPRPELAEEPAPEPQSSPHRGRLYPHGPPPAESAGPDPGHDPAVGRDAPGPLWGSAWILGALCGVAGLVLFVRFARRHRRRRASLGGHPPRR